MNSGSLLDLSAKCIEIFGGMTLCVYLIWLIFEHCKSEHSRNTFKETWLKKQKLMLKYHWTESKRFNETDCWLWTHALVSAWGLFQYQAHYWALDLLWIAFMLYKHISILVIMFILYLIFAFVCFVVHWFTEQTPHGWMHCQWVNVIEVVTREGLYSTRE